MRYVDRTLLDLDSARWLFRGFAVVFYLLGALLAFVLAARLFGHWTWGFANGLLWLAAPGLIAMSIQLRPDVAARRALPRLRIRRSRARSSAARCGWYAAAAALVGFATMVKLHALALLLAAASSPRSGVRRRKGSCLRRSGRARGFVRAHRAAVGSIAGLWLALAVLLNWDRFPFHPGSSQLAVTSLRARRRASRPSRLAQPAARVLSRFYALLVVVVHRRAVHPGHARPAGRERARFSTIVRNMSGQGVQEGIDPFSTPLSALDGIVGTPIVFVFLLALVAGIVGVVRREPVPVVWAVAALATGVFAYARPPNVHYFAPAFVFSALALLWLLQREPRARMPLLAWVIVLYVVWPAWDNRLNSAAEQERVRRHRREREVSTSTRSSPRARSRSFRRTGRSRTRATSSSCRSTSTHSPDYPYRYLPATAARALVRAAAPDATALLRRPARARTSRSRRRSSSAISAGIPSSRVKGSWQRSSRGPA